MNHGPKKSKVKNKKKKNVRKKGVALQVLAKTETNLQTLFNKSITGPTQYSSMQSFCEVIAKTIKQDEVLIPHPPIKQIAFQGGGNKGAAYPGVGQALAQSGYLDDVDTVVGASAGAITAFFFGLGFSGEQFKALSAKTNFLDFTDVSPNGWGAFFNGHGAGNIMDLIELGGAYTGEGFYHWARALIEQILGDPDATFADLHRLRLKDPALKDLIFKGTRYHAKPGDVIEQTFSFSETPNIRIADALRASMAFPGAFTPHIVRDKEGKIFGVFADGGILNNYPIDELNKPEYNSPHYAPIQRKNNLGRDQLVNPCVVGFHLVDDPKELDEEITPFTDRLRRIHRERLAQPKEAFEMKEAEELSAKWRFNDILKAIFWNQVGVTIKEEDIGKQTLFKEQTVQIWTEDVTTLEFDAPAHKLENLFLSGKNATLKWLEKFKDPHTPYLYPEQYDDRLTKAETVLKQKNPEALYKKKLTEYYEEIIKEMRKLELQKKTSDSSIKLNVRLRFLSLQIAKIINEMQMDANFRKTPTSIAKQAFEKACHNIEERTKALKAQHEKRWNLVENDRLVKVIAENLIQSPKSGIRLLRGQLSRVISLMKTSQGSNILSLIVQVGDVRLAKEAFDILQNAYTQCYYQGRKEDIKYTLPLMLNEIANPPLFSVLANQNNPEMVKLVLKYGANPLRIHPKTHINGLQEMVKNNNYESFKAIVEYCKSLDYHVGDMRFGSKSISHYILYRQNYLDGADDSFLQKLYQDKKFAKYLLNYHIKDENYNDILLEAARLSESPDDIRWKLISELSSKRSLNFNNLKMRAQTNYKSHKDKILLAHEVYHAILQASEPSVLIEEIKPQICYNILYAYVKGELRLCQMAQDPTKADIFIALCERIRQNRKVFHKLQQTLRKKINGKTALYYAAQGGNEKLVAYLRQPKYDLDINHAGPIETPCALIIAAKNGHHGTVSALMKSIPFGYRVGSHAQSRRQADYFERKTALHYLGMWGKAQAFCDVLYGTDGRKLPIKVANMKDSLGKTPLSYIIEHNRMDILEEILNRGKGKHKGYILNKDYRFAQVFGWHSHSPEGYPDLELAKRINPKMYAYLCEHLSHNKLKSFKVIQQVEAKLGERRQEELKRQFQSAQQATKIEMSTLGASEYDNFVTDESTTNNRKISIQKITPSYDIEQHRRSFTVKMPPQTQVKDATMAPAKKVRFVDL